MHHRLHPPALEQRRGVVDPATHRLLPRLYGAHEQGAALRGQLCELPQRRTARAGEAGALQQIPGGVPGEGQLGGDDELGAPAARLRPGTPDPVRVAGDVADEGVDLGEGHAHGGILGPAGRGGNRGIASGDGPDRDQWPRSSPTAARRGASSASSRPHGPRSIVAGGSSPST